MNVAPKEIEASWKPQSALRICCMVVVAFFAAIAICCQLLDRLGFAASAFGLLVVATLPLAYCMSLDPSKLVRIQSVARHRSGIALAVGLWCFYSFLTLVALRRVLG